MNHDPVPSEPETAAAESLYAVMNVAASGEEAFDAEVIGAYPNDGGKVSDQIRSSRHSSADYVDPYDENREVCHVLEESAT